MKTLQRKQVEVGTRSSSLTATELGDSSQVLRGRAEALGHKSVTATRRNGSKNFVPFSRHPSPCGLVQDRLSPPPPPPTRHPVSPTSGLWTFHSSVGVEKG